MAPNAFRSTPEDLANPAPMSVSTRPGWIATVVSHVSSKCSLRTNQFSAALLAPYGLTPGIWAMVSAAPLLPIMDEMPTKTGFLDGLALSSGAAARKRTSGATELTVKCSRADLNSTSETLAGAPVPAMPALAMTTSRAAMPCSVRMVSTAAAGSDSTNESILTTTSREPSPLGRSARALEEGFDGSRTPAMTVVEGRRSSRDTKPRPIPRLAPVMRYVRPEDIAKRGSEWASVLQGLLRMMQSSIVTL
ncbi:hypothetical protein CTA2_12003 [Colletotrichum tanaceti]|nr:hypothetical protein CTA2_12003 [Colletotrichum tanaceti]